MLICLCIAVALFTLQWQSRAAVVETVHEAESIYFLSLYFNSLQISVLKGSFTSR